ncbi:MAG: phytanoyl-CoA dioxygenase family protein [Pirellulales bacterium]|nr:phytanoyl-CoA dioxygenase family protein [Pirellulales bacterium]
MKQAISPFTTLDPAKHAEYWRRGWVVVEGVFDPAKAAAISELAVSIGEVELDAVGRSEETADRSADGKLATRKLREPFFKHRALREFALNFSLREIVRQLIGKPAQLAADSLFMKPPRFGTAKPYHQDNAYFICRPPDDVVTAWIALDNVDEENGCLRYIDGSHRESLLDHVPIPGEPHNLAPRPEQIDLSRESLAPVRQGGVVFHHGGTLHTSHRNHSNRWRRGYATHWVSGDVKSEVDFVERAYFTAAPELYQEALSASCEGSKCVQ